MGRAIAIEFSDDELAEAERCEETLFAFLRFDARAARCRVIRGVGPPDDIERLAQGFLSNSLSSEVTATEAG